jgi:ankyrin repeat protein
MLFLFLPLGHGAPATSALSPESSCASTPLHKAAAAGDITVLVILAERDHLDARDSEGLTPFHRAVQSGHLHAAALLLDKGADVNARDPQGNTALHRLFFAGPPHIQTVPPPSWLRRKQADPKMRPYVRYLVENAEDPSMVRTPFAAAFLLAAGADPEATNNAGQRFLELALSESASVFDEERVDLLRLMGQANPTLINRPDAKGDSPLHRAVRGFDQAPVADLIAAGADVNATNRLGRTPLHAAVETLGTWPSPLLKLLEAKPNVNARDAKGMTPLHLIALSQSPFAEEATKALLRAGADPNARDNRGRTPLHLFLSGKRPWNHASQCILLLVDAGADLAARDDYGRTPLHYLAARGTKGPLFFIPEIDNLFLAAKVDLEARDHLGNTPLHVAARRNTRDVFDWLVKHGADLDATNRVGQTPRGLAALPEPASGFSPTISETDIFSAAVCGNLVALEKLLRARPALLNRTNAAGQTPLRLAAQVGRTNVVEFLEARGAQWDALSAVLAGRADVLRSLLARDARAVLENPQNRELLHQAATRGDLAATKLLLQAGCDPHAPNAAGLTPVGLAHLHQHPEVAQALRAGGASLTIFDAVRLGDVKTATAMLNQNRSLLNATNPMGFSLPEVTVASGNVELLKLLLELGVDPNAPSSRYGSTLLHMAAIANRTACARLLLERGGDPDRFDHVGWSPLHWAAFLGNAEMVGLLIQHGADPNQTTRKLSAQFAFPSGNTPLHLAAAGLRPKAVEQLLKSGAAVNARNSDGRTPLDMTMLQFGGQILFNLNMLCWYSMERGLGPFWQHAIEHVPPDEQSQRLPATLRLLEKAGGERTPWPGPYPTSNSSPGLRAGVSHHPLPAYIRKELTNAASNPETIKP